MRQKLSQQRAGMTLTELKNYGKTTKEINNIKKYFERLQKVAVNLATVNLVDSSYYKETANRIQEEFNSAFFEYQMFNMNPFLNAMETIAEEAVNSIESLSQFQSCQNEDPICEGHLKEAYEFVYHPFEINKFPFETLGFGIYMAYFSFLLVSSDTQAFLGRTNLYDGEKVVRSYQSEVLGNLTKQNIGNMSLFEMVEILHHNNFGYDDTSLLQTLKKEMNCDRDKDFLPMKTKYENGEKPCKKYAPMIQISFLWVKWFQTSPTYFKQVKCATFLGVLKFT